MENNENKEEINDNLNNIQETELQEFNSQDFQQLEQQQQPQQSQLELQNQNQQSQQEQMFDMSGLVNSLNNEIFLNENNLDGIIQLLMLDRETQFDLINLNEDNLEKKLEIILKQRSESLQNNLGGLLNVYEQKMNQGQLGNLEKIMSILKSKKKEVHLKRIQPKHNFRCNKHQHTHTHLDGDINNNKLYNQEQQQQNFQNLQKFQKEKITNIQNFQKQNQIQSENSQQDIIADQQINQQASLENIQIIDQANQSMLQRQQNKLDQETKEKNQIEYNNNESEQDQQKQKIKKILLKLLNIIKNRKSLDQIDKVESQLNTQQDQNLLQGQNMLVQQDEGNQCQQNEKNQHEVQKPQMKIISIQDLANILNMKFFDLELFQEYDPVEKSISFKLNDGYIVQVKSSEQISIEKYSSFSKIPQIVIQQNIFSYFSAFELFKLRGVTKEWREMVRTVWHKTFKREMYEQLMAADLCKEIENEFKLVHLRNPFRQKLALLLKAIIELINWDQLENQIQENKLELRGKRVLFCVQKILRSAGPEFSEIAQLRDFQESHFELMKENLSSKLRTSMNTIFSQTFHFDKKKDINQIKSQFLDSYDLCLEQFSGAEDKNMLLFVLFLKQVYVYALLKNYIFIVQSYIVQAKKKLDAISKDWPENKGFLEGAYKILLLRNVRIRNKKIVNEESDQENDEQEEEEEKNNEKIDSELQGEKLMKSLFNFQGNCHEPDIVIKKRGYETKVFLDNQTKLDILLNSLVNLSGNVMEKIQVIYEKTQEIKVLQQQKEQSEHNIKEIQQSLQNKENSQEDDQLEYNLEIIQKQQRKNQNLENQLEIENYIRTQQDQEENKNNNYSKPNNNNIKLQQSGMEDNLQFQQHNENLEQQQQDAKQLQNQNEIQEINQEFLRKFQKFKSQDIIIGFGLKLILK